MKLVRCQNDGDSARMQIKERRSADCCLQSQLPLCRTVRCPGFRCCVRLRGDPTMTAHTGRVSSPLRVYLSVLGDAKPSFRSSE